MKIEVIFYENDRTTIHVNYVIMANGLKTEIKLKMMKLVGVFVFHLDAMQG